MTVLGGLSNALSAGAIPAQGQVVLLSLHANLMNLEYGVDGVVVAWQRTRTRLFASLSVSLDNLAPDIDCGKISASLLIKLHEQLTAYATTDFGQSKEKVVVGKNMLAKLVDRLCPQCKKTPCVFSECQKCGSGSLSLGWAATKCVECLSGKPLCPSCVSGNRESKKMQEEAKAV